MKLALLLATLAVLCAASPAAGARGPHLAERFGGLGTWVDIFDGPAWERPESVVRDMSRHGVATLYLQTASSRRGPAVFRPDRAARFLLAAHSRGMRVIAWYLPPWVDSGYETRRALAAIRYRSADGHKFDGFALDIETAAGSPKAAVRNRRLLNLSRRLRRTVGNHYPLGAITPSPYGLAQPHGRRWWPDFPFQQLNAFYDAFLPMGYYTYHGHGAKATAKATRLNFEILRRETGDPTVPIHMIGGGGADSNLSEGRAFTRAVNQFGAIGASMYDHMSMGPEDWRALRGLRFKPVLR